MTERLFDKILIIFIFFVSPLLFFTNLTRNPYAVQNFILGLCVPAALIPYVYGIYKNGRARRQASPLAGPLAVFTVFSCLSLILSYFLHNQFFRPSVINGGGYGVFFLLVNSLAVFMLPSVFSRGAAEENKYSSKKWLFFILICGSLWFLYPVLRTDFSGQNWFYNVFDPYGFLVWGIGFFIVWKLLGRGNTGDIWRLIVSVGIIASLYGIMQFFGLDLIWKSRMNPYGNRPVSTFGNPNFISSFLVMILPYSLSGLLFSSGFYDRLFYGLSVFSSVGMLLASLTRSSWIGAAVGVATLFLLSGRTGFRKRKGNGKFAAVISVSLLLFVLLWPSGRGKSFSSCVFGRLAEAGDRIKPGGISLDVKENEIYSSFHQRLLIWASAWQMGKENPVFGRGEGLFESFFPFYQGRLLASYPQLRSLRTHGNNAHNELLERWAEGGIVGLGLFLWIFVSLFFFCFKNRKNADFTEKTAPFAAAAAGMLADNMLNVSLHFAVPGMLFWWTLGCIHSAAAEISGGDAVPARRGKKLFPVFAVVLPALLFCAVYSYRNFAGEILYFSGTGDLLRKDYASAVEKFERAVSYNRHNVHCNYDLGNTLYGEGRTESAAKVYRKALEVNPGYDEIYFNLGVSLYGRGEYAEALKYTTVSSVINPFNLNAWRLLGKLYSVTGKDRLGADKAFSEAVRLYPDKTEILNAASFFASSAGDLPGALRLSERAFKLDPDDGVLFDNYVASAGKIGVPAVSGAKWIAVYRKLKNIAYSEAWKSRGNYAETIKEADWLVSQAPYSLRPYYLRAQLYFKAGDYEKARADLETVYGRDKNDMNALSGLSVIYEKTGRYGKAAEALRELLKAMPEDAYLKDRLEKLNGKEEMKAAVPS